MTHETRPPEVPDLSRVGRLHLAQCSLGTFLYFPNDLIGRFLDHYGEWSQAETDMLQGLLPKGGVALDVGGNIGWMAVALGQAAGPEGRVYTLEPLEEVYHVLCSNLALNALGNVVPLRMAAGSAPARLDAPRFDAAEQAFLSATELGGVERKAPAKGLPDPGVIEVVTLDTLFADLERLDLIKIDIEGMEPEALAGAKALIARCQPTLWIEVNKPEVAARVLPDLSAMGYVAFWHVSPGHNPDNHRGTTHNIAGTLGDVNVLAVPQARAAEYADLHKAERFEDVARLFPGALDMPAPLWRRALRKLRGGGQG